LADDKGLLSSRNFGNMRAFDTYKQFDLDALKTTQNSLPQSTHISTINRTAEAGGTIKQ